MTVRNAPRAPVPAAALPEFAPVPRKPRHDGWTPERQKAFVAALADTGCVSIACRMVNMSQRSFYHLRRQPGAESFRAAAEAAQTLGLQVVKDEAFDRAMNGELIPVFVGGKLMGFRRRKNDRLLMFILRHYGTDAAGRKTTVNYFSTRATASAGAETPSLPADPSAVASAKAEASTTTVKTIISGTSGQSTTLARTDSAAALLNAFEGAALDEEARAEIYRSLEACAERRRALEAAPEDDPDRFYIGAGECGAFLGTLEIGAEEDLLAFRSGACPEQGLIGEHRWESLGEGGNAAAIDEAVASVQAAIAASTPEQREADREADRAEIEREAPRLRQSEGRAALPWSRDAEAPDGLRRRRQDRRHEAAFVTAPGPSPNPDDPRLDWRNWAEDAYTPPAETPSPSRGEGRGGGGASAARPEPVEPKGTVGQGPASVRPEPVEGRPPVSPKPSPNPKSPTPAEGPPSAMTAGAIAPPRHRGEPAPAGRPAPLEATGPTSRSRLRDGPPASSEKAKRSYKARVQKPPFTLPNAEAETRARQAVAADRRIAAEAEAVRRARRS